MQITDSILMVVFVSVILNTIYGRKGVLGEQVVIVRFMVNIFAIISGYLFAHLLLEHIEKIYRIIIMFVFLILVYSLIEQGFKFFLIRKGRKPK